MTGLLLSNLYKDIVKKLILKFVDIFPNHLPNSLNIFTELGKLIADYTKSIERSSNLLCRNFILSKTVLNARLNRNRLKLKHCQSGSNR